MILLHRRIITRLTTLATAAAFVAFWSVPGRGQDVAVQPARETPATELLRRPVSLDLDRTSLRQALKALAHTAGIRIIFQEQTLPADPAVVSLHAARMPLGVALDHVLHGTGLTATVVTDDVVSIKAPGAQDAPDDGVITGTVRDAATKQPLRGVQVVLDDAKNGVATDDAGTFRIASVATGHHVLHIRKLNYVKRIQEVTVENATPVVVNVTLEPGVNTLDQVVVTGTVIPTELKAVPSAITVITAKQIEERGITHIDQLFRGDVPGLFAENRGSINVADTVVMFSRGATAINSVDAGTNPIKTYVDGVELANPAYLSQIDPRSIERIEILPGPQASTIYGSNAINGVMQIFTKRGASNVPQLTLNLMSGLVENNFSSARTPQHDYTGQVNGVEGRVSYNAGGSWNYMGPWTPAKRTTTFGGFGGARLSLPTPVGAVTGDFTMRRTTSTNKQGGMVQQSLVDYWSTGFYDVVSFNGVSAASKYTTNGQTIGVTMGYNPTSWWSHELVLGQDVTESESQTMPRNVGIYDTSLSLSQSHMQRRSLRYATTVQIPVASIANASVTMGADAWNTLETDLSAQPTSFTGPLTDPCVASGYSCTNISRQPGHNRGAFVQSQVGLFDQLFLTYGLRGEWNPNYGKDALPNYAPRYGVAYTHSIGPITAKLRASYGRSTRPPGPSLKEAVPAFKYYARWFGMYDEVLENPGLAPELQQGGEGGLELYLGTRASLIVTHYNQTVDNLILRPQVDSVRSLMPDPYQNGGNCYTSSQPGPYCYTPQYENVNTGSIRNQGWELQGTTTLGPLTGRGTYSWTKGRVLGLTPVGARFYGAYAAYQPGASILLLPEHTWALGATYATARSTITLTVTGTGQAPVMFDDSYFRLLGGSIRLMENKANTNQFARMLTMVPGYAMADLTASRRLSSKAEAVLEVRNLTNHYDNDYSGGYAVIGRQGKAGFRLRLN